MLSQQFPVPRLPINMIDFSSHDHMIVNKLRLSSLSSGCVNDFAELSRKHNSSVSKSRLARKAKCATNSGFADGTEQNDLMYLAGSLDRELMPKHVAVIMDGNRRWAKNRGLPIQVGYRAGAKAMKQLAINCKKYGVKVLSIFTFSTENWFRPEEEVHFLMNLSEQTIVAEMEELLQNDVRVFFLGNKSRLPLSLQELITTVEERAKDNKGPSLLLAGSYSGRYDITEAAKKIATKVSDGVLQVTDIEDSIIEQHLETNGVEFPNPDLLIRTSGELRVSNFMLWQLAYSEMFFTKKPFPSFEEADLVQALTEFQRRQRQC